MSKLIYKEDEYTYKELERLRNTKTHLFSEGEVLDTETGEVIDIRSLSKLRERYVQDAINNLYKVEENKSSLHRKMRLEDTKLKLIKLQEKYNSKNISIDELKMLISLKYDKNELKKSYSFSSYYFVNTNYKLPDLSFDELGKFHTLCYYFLTHKSNTLLNSKNKKSSPLTKEGMMELFKLKESSFYRFIGRLKEKNILDTFKVKDKTYYILNPMYALNGKITPINYIIFKEDVDKYLPNIPQELRDLWIMEFQEIGVEL
jgi:hypothetical protein